MARRSSVISRFRLAAVAVIVGVAVIGAVFYAVVNTHFIGLVVSRTLGPYSDSLSQVGFGSPDPDVWQKREAEREYQRVLAAMETQLAETRFMLGDRPTALAKPGARPANR